MADDKMPWWEKAIRDHAEKHGPSGGGWNISMLLERLSAAERRTPARANAQKMLEALKVAQKRECDTYCLAYRDDHSPQCLNMQSIIADAEGRENNEPRS